jgi:hypothetical protein
MHWEEIGVCNKEYRLIDSTGRISGIVKGASYSSIIDDTYHAHVERVDAPHVQLGRYTTADLAKKAVETWWEELKVSKRDTHA